MTLTQITEKGIKDGEIVNADINASAAIAKSKLASLDIVNADINASAAIAKSKLAALDIVNADINASAAIAGTKISPDFGSQNIVTTGTLTSGSAAFSSAVTTSADVLSITGTSFADNEKIFTTFKRGTIHLGKLGVEVISAGQAGNLLFETASSGTSAEHMRLDSTGKLLIGHNAAVFSSTAKFQLSGDGHHYLQVSRFTADANANRLRFFKSRSATVGTASTTLSGDTLGLVDFYGVDASNNSRIAASINAEMDGSSSTNTMPGRITFKTTPTTFGAAQERMRIDSSGKVRIGCTAQPSPTVSGAQFDAGGIGLRISLGGGTSGTSAAGITVMGGGNSTNIAAAASYGGTINLTNTNNTDGNSNAVLFLNSNQLATSSVVGITTSHSNRNGELAFLTSSAAAPAERMRIDESGKVGINTTSPQSDLHIGASGGDDNHSIRIDGTNNTSGGQVHRFVIENLGESALVNFKTSSADATETTKVSIKSITGDIGIGTTNPTEKVHVAAGNVRISGASGGTLVLGGSSAHTSKLVIGSNDGTTNGNLLIEGGDGTDFITISSGGNVEIHDGNLKLASGHGIDFSATSDATGKTSEKLDDYEEGTWTPTYMFNGTVASTQPTGRVGQYTRIGDRVFISCHISGASVGTFSGYFQIGGLPFNNASGKYTALCGWVYAGFDDNHKIIFRTNPNADKIEVQYAGSSVYTSNMNYTANYMIGGNYPV